MAGYREIGDEVMPEDFLVISASGLEFMEIKELIKKYKINYTYINLDDVLGSDLEDLFFEDFATPREKTWEELEQEERDYAEETAYEAYKEERRGI